MTGRDISRFSKAICSGRCAMTDQEMTNQEQPSPEAPAMPPGDQSILRDIETASESIAMYTAIIGKRLEIVEPSEDDGLEDGSHPIMTISPNWPHVNRMMISVWFRRMSHTARRRLDQAIMRLAS